MTVRCKDRNLSGKTKLERLGKRATTDKATVFNNLGHLLDQELFQTVYRQMVRKKAVGIDGVTKEAYGVKLEERIENLIQRIHKGTYHPKPARIVEIPKEDGSTRPLAIACFEDKLVQAAVSQILTEVYEPLFLPCSYGFRPNRSCHDALRGLQKQAYPCWDGAVVEIDIQKYFNSIPHTELKAILRKKISDERFLNLIDKLATAPIIREGKTTRNEIGCPQGSIISPILSNIYLHEVIDAWFEETRTLYLQGKAEEVRYADDMVFVFERYGEAKRFFEVLPKRLKKYGLEMHLDKSRIIPSGQNVAQRAHRQGRRIPTYQFLGFTVYWGKARNGKWWRIKYTSRRDRFSHKVQGLKSFLRKNLSTSDTEKTLRSAISVVRGWVNYHAISDNERRVNSFLRVCRGLMKKWINRKGRKKPITWENFNKYIYKLGYPDQVNTTSMFGKLA